jgi:Mg/Co/Ni transporter MgtE
MIPEQSEDRDVDAIFRKALQNSNDLIIPEGLAEKTIRNLEKKILLRELITELLLKTGLVVGSLILLTVVFFLLKGKGVLDWISNRINDHWQIIVSILVLVIFTILIDQIGIKFYGTINRKTV